MKAAVPTRLPEPRPVLVAAADVVSRVLRPRNLAGAVAATAFGVWVGGPVGLVLGAVAAPFLLGVAARTGLRYTGRGRTRLEHGHTGWATRRELAEHQPTGPSTRLGSTTVGPPVPIPLRAAHEDSVLILGGPRRGKTLTASDIARQHRGKGPRYLSSTRFDVLRATISARRKGEAPAWVFVPEGASGATGLWLRLMVQAGWIRPMHWSPIAGCTDPLVASARAAALMEATDTGDTSDATWIQSATTVLRCLLRAAALGGLDMRALYGWVTGPDTSEPFDLLEDHGAHRWAWELRAELLSDNEPGVASVLQALRRGVEFIANDAVAQACCPGPNDEQFDAREFLESDGDLYVIGRERKRQGTQPLMAALTTYLYDTAVQVADEQKSGKLPRTLLLLCDELKVTARVPWDDWLATAGGSGIHMVGVAQSPAQLREKWGEHGSAAIVDNSTSVLVFGGLKNEGDLRAFAELCDERREPLPEDPSRSEWRPVMTKARLSGLRKFRALHLGGGLPHPTILSTARWVKAHEVTGTLRVMAPGIYVAVRTQLTAPQRRAIPAATRAPIPMPPAQRDRQIEHATRKAS